MLAKEEIPPQKIHLPGNLTQKTFLSASSFPIPLKNANFSIFLYPKLGSLGVLVVIYDLKAARHSVTLC